MDSQNPSQPPKPDDTPLKKDIVDNIPLHQAEPQANPAPIKETENIDGIMKDVAHQLKEEDQKPQKHHWFGHKTEQSKLQPAPVKSQASAPAPVVPATGPVPRQAAPAPRPTHALEPKNKAPVLAIVFTLIVTAFLVVAAISAYKK